MPPLAATLRPIPISIKSALHLSKISITYSAVGIVSGSNHIVPMEPQNPSRALHSEKIPRYPLYLYPRYCGVHHNCVPSGIFPLHTSQPLNAWSANLRRCFNLFKLTLLTLKGMVCDHNTPSSTLIGPAFHLYIYPTSFLPI